MRALLYALLMVVLPAQAAHLVESASTELIGKDDTGVAASRWSKSAQIVFGGALQGEITSLVLTSTEEGSGAVQVPLCYIVFFDADPAITANDATITAAEWQTVIGTVTVLAADWVAVDANGSSVFKAGLQVPVRNMRSVYVAILLGAAMTTINSAAGDDEVFDIVVQAAAH